MCRCKSREGGGGVIKIGEKWGDCVCTYARGFGVRKRAREGETRIREGRREERSCLYVPASYRACDHVLKTSLFSQCVHPGHMHVRVLHFHVCTYVLYTLFTCSVVESKTGQFHCSLNANTSYRGFSNIHAVCTYTHQRKHTLQTLVGETYACLLCDISRKHAIEMRACTDTQVFTESGCAIILCTLGVYCGCV